MLMVIVGIREDDLKEKADILAEFNLLHSDASIGNLYANGPSRFLDEVQQRISEANWNGYYVDEVDIM